MTTEEKLGKQKPGEKERWTIRHRMKEGQGHKGVKGKALWELQIGWLPWEPKLKGKKMPCHGRLDMTYQEIFNLSKWQLGGLEGL